MLERNSTVFEHYGMQLFARTAKHGSDLAAEDSNSIQPYQKRRLKQRLRPMLKLKLTLRLGLRLKPLLDRSWALMRHLESILGHLEAILRRS